MLVGQGGSIPLVAEFADAFPGAAILVTAVGDPDSRPHGIDESLHLGDFEAACVAETLFLQGLADTSSHLTRDFCAAVPPIHVLGTKVGPEVPPRGGADWLDQWGRGRSYSVAKIMIPRLNRVRPGQTSR